MLVSRDQCILKFFSLSIINQDSVYLTDIFLAQFIRILIIHVHPSSWSYPQFEV